MTEHSEVMVYRVFVLTRNATKKYTDDKVIYVDENHDQRDDVDCDFAEIIRNSRKSMAST